MKHEKKKYQPLIAPEIHWVDVTQVEDPDFYKSCECTIKPIENGFGTTYGNVFRRILLGGIEGSAVTSIIIDGVNNECAVIPGVLEDVVTIVMRIKELIIENTTGEPGTLSVKDFGKGVLKGENFVGSEHLSILNRDMTIANIAEDGKISITLFVESGRGFKKADWGSNGNKKLQPDGKIFINAFFAPVKNVTFDVQKTRIGKDIDYDKLIIKITTDGTITPQYAFQYALSVAMGQFGSLLESQQEKAIQFTQRDSQNNKDQERDKMFSSAVSEAFGGGSSKKVKGGVSQIPEQVRYLLQIGDGKITPEFLLKPIDVLELPTRAHNCLIGIGIQRVIDLVNMSDTQLRSIDHFGKKSYEDLVEKMHDQGLSFGMNIKESDVVLYIESVK